MTTPSKDELLKQYAFLKSGAIYRFSGYLHHNSALPSQVMASLPLYDEKTNSRLGIIHGGKLFMFIGPVFTTRNGDGSMVCRFKVSFQDFFGMAAIHSRFNASMGSFVLVSAEEETA